MPIVSLHGVSFSGLAWTFKLLPRKHTEANIWYGGPFASTLRSPVYGLLGR
jgi:hypothetical protein